MKKEDKLPTKKLTLCGICNKPIHINDFGGVSKDNGFHHSNCLDARIKECRFNPKEKYSKQLGRNEKMKLWGIYSQDKKNYKNFEQFCSIIVRVRKLLK